jgi:hypothetical protein
MISSAGKRILLWITKAWRPSAEGLGTSNLFASVSTNATCEGLPKRKFDLRQGDFMGKLMFKLWK